MRQRERVYVAEEKVSIQLALFRQIHCLWRHHAGQRDFVDSLVPIGSAKSDPDENF